MTSTISCTTLLSVVASLTPTLRTIFESFGTSITLEIPRDFCNSGHIFSSYNCFNRVFSISAYLYNTALHRLHTREDLLFSNFLTLTREGFLHEPQTGITFANPI